jgi:hypothetical protein
MSDTFEPAVQDPTLAEALGESTNGVTLADAPETPDQAVPFQDEANQDAADAQDEMLSSLGLDDVPDEVQGGEQEAKPEPQLYLVVAPSGGIACVEPMAALEDLQARLMALEGEDVQVFIFSGERYQVTKGPYRYLTSPSADAIELFDLPKPEELEIDDEGYLGPPSSALEIPPPLPEELDEEGIADEQDGWGGEPPDQDEEPPP